MLHQPLHKLAPRPPARARLRRTFAAGWCFLAAAWPLTGKTLTITALDRAGRLTWSDALAPGICSVETAATMTGGWQPARSVFATNSVGGANVAVNSSNQFFRVRTVTVLPTAAGFTNLVQAYGRLETAAGNGFNRIDNTSFWQNSFEGGPATNAALSRPHYAMADRAGNVFIVDKNSHAVLRVDTNGLIHTLAGTHVGGFNGEGPAAATTLQLNVPNGLWVRADGTVYVLDTGNARVRRITTNGVMSTLFFAQSDTNSALTGGRCLWVKDDESLAYFGNSTRLRKWTPGGGVQTLASGYTELGTFCVLASGNLIVADRGGNYVYSVTASGTQTVIAGNGTASGGGEGAPALATGFYGPRGVWPVPTGGYLLLLHDGAQLWYVDAANLGHLLVNGLGGNVFVQAGDGGYFYAPEQFFIGEGRSVTMDVDGNILVCESDYGFIRRIRFQRMSTSH